jgi:hypothetical protein
MWRAQRDGSSSLRTDDVDGAFYEDFALRVSLDTAVGWR